MLSLYATRIGQRHDFKEGALVTDVVSMRREAAAASHWWLSARAICARIPLMGSASAHLAPTTCSLLVTISPASEHLAYTRLARLPSWASLISGMDADSDFSVQTRFEKYAEFVALQDQALSLDATPHVSDEELGRRINLMWSISNIVCRK